MRFNMSVPKAFDFTGEVAIVTGAGSRMPGWFSFAFHTRLSAISSLTGKFQARSAMAEQQRFSSPAKGQRLRWWTTMLNGLKKQSA
jgi:hypothetical protein